MATNKNIQEPEVNVGEALSKTEKFFDTYKNHIIYGTAAIIAVVVAVMLFHNFVTLPAQQEAMAQTYTAEQYFRNGDFEKALDGDGNALGFNQIISDYGTKAGEAVYFYAGVCELQLGNWESAIKYLQAYNGKDAILAARAQACIGDAYVGLEDYSKALGYFEKAAATIDNMFAAGYLLKAGVVAEKLGENAKALSFYEKIKDQYPQSMEAYDIDKYIGRIEAR